MLFATGDTPSAPKIQQPNFSAHVLRRQRLRRIVKLRQLKSRRGFVDERRRNLMRIATSQKDNAESKYQHKKERERNEDELFHHLIHGAAAVATVATFTD